MSDIYIDIDIIPDYDITFVDLKDYNDEIKDNFLSNFKNYTKLKTFYCNNCNLTELPDFPDSLIHLYCANNNLTKIPNLPNLLTHLWISDNNLTELPKLPKSLIYLYCSNNNLIELPDLPKSLNQFECLNNNNLNLNYPNLEIKTINKTNLKNRIIKRMKLLNRTLLLEQSAKIIMNPKRIQRLLDNKEINFFDGSFDNLTS